MRGWPVARAPSVSTRCGYLRCVPVRGKGRKRRGNRQDGQDGCGAEWEAKQVGEEQEGRNGTERVGWTTKMPEALYSAPLVARVCAGPVLQNLHNTIIRYERMGLRHTPDAILRKAMRCGRRWPSVSFPSLTARWWQPPFRCESPRSDGGGGCRGCERWPQTCAQVTQPLQERVLGWYTLSARVGVVYM